MPKVDFYVLSSGAADARLVLACRIAEKAFKLEQKVLINTDSRMDASRLDELLWTFSQGSFVPHRVIGSDSGPGIEPVLIGYGEEPVDETPDLMINLAAGVPGFFDRCKRVAELVDADDARRAQGRERFRRYRELGCELDTHQM